MKVAILVNNKQSKEVDSYSEQALGPAYVAQSTKNAGHDVKLYNQYPSIEELLEFDVVGFSVNSQDVPDVLKTAKQLKKQNPKIVTVAGGPHVSGEIFDRKIRWSKGDVKGVFKNNFDFPITNDSWMDVTIGGEGEYTSGFLENFKNAPYHGIFKSEGPVISNSKRIKNLDSLPFPTEFRDPKTFLQPVDNSSTPSPMIPIIESRGCPGPKGKTCDFCSSKASWGRKIRYRSAENILQEVEEVAKTYNLPKENTQVFFDSLELMINKEKLWYLMHLFKNSGYELASCGDLRFATQENLEFMKKGGYGTVMWGIESLDPKILEKYKPKLTLQQIEKGLELARSYGIRNCSLLMLGFPEETEKSIEEWTKKIQDLPLDAVRVSIATPFPGTEFRRNLLRQGYKIEPYSNRWDTSHLVYNHKNISKKGLEEIRQEISI